MAAKRTNGSEAGYFDSAVEDGKPVTIDSHSGAVTVEDDGDSIPVIDPATISAEPDTGEPPSRKRGRPRGSKGGGNASKASQKETASDLTAILMSLHFMGATILKVPELELDEEEAEKLGKAVARVQAQYEVPVLSEEQRAWINLLLVAGTIYGPRVMAHSLNRKRKPKGEHEPVTIDAEQVVH